MFNTSSQNRRYLWHRHSYEHMYRCFVCVEMNENSLKIYQCEEEQEETEYVRLVFGRAFDRSSPLGESNTKESTWPTRL